MCCPVCKSGNVSLFEVKETGYKRCLDCGSITMVPESRLSSDGQKSRYELHNNTLEDEGYRKYLEKFLTDCLQAYRSEKGVLPSVVLDFGSGPEPCLVQLMKEKGMKAFGWDPYFNTEGLADCSPGQEFDLVTCLEVAEHFENPEESFRYLASLVKKGGMAVIGTNLLPEETVQPFAKWWYRFDPTHVTFYTLKGLQTVASSAGLSYVKSLTDKVFVFCRL